MTQPDASGPALAGLAAQQVSALLADLRSHPLLRAIEQAMTPQAIVESVVPQIQQFVLTMTDGIVQAPPEQAYRVAVTALHELDRARAALQGTDADWPPPEARAADHWPVATSLVAELPPLPTPGEGGPIPADCTVGGLGRYLPAGHDTRRFAWYLQSVSDDTLRTVRDAAWTLPPDELNLLVQDVTHTTVRAYHDGPGDATRCAPDQVVLQSWVPEDCCAGSHARVWLGARNPYRDMEDPWDDEAWQPWHCGRCGSQQTPLTTRGSDHSAGSVRELIDTHLIRCEEQAEELNARSMDVRDRRQGDVAASIEEEIAAATQDIAPNDRAAYYAAVAGVAGAAGAATTYAAAAPGGGGVRWTLLDEGGTFTVELAGCDYDHRAGYDPTRGEEPLVSATVTRLAIPSPAMSGPARGVGGPQI